MKTAEEYMKIALLEANIAKELDEVPVGAIVVYHGEVIAKAHNLKEHTQLASSHAEMLAIQEASKVLGTWCLDQCDLYVTLEPCLMCTGIIELSRINTLYYGTADPKGGSIDSLIQIKKIKHLNTYPKTIVPNVLHDECAEILTSFFQEKRKKMKLEKEIKKAEEC